MDETAAALGAFLEATTDQVRRLKSTYSDVLLVAQDAVAAALKGKPLYSPAQQEYAKEFKHWLQDPRGHALRMSQCVSDLSTKDVTIASNPSGGYGVPKQLADEIESFARPLCPLLKPEVCGVMPVTTSDFHQPVTLADSSATRTSESGTRTATGTATFADRVPSWGEYSAFVTASQHAREDMGDRLQRWLAKDIAEQIGAQLMTDIVSGTGSGQVLGITHTAPVTTADFASPQRSMDAIQYQAMAGASIVLGDIENLLGNFGEGYLTADDFTFIMRPSTWFKLFGVGRAGTGSIEAPFLMPRFSLAGLYGFRVETSGNAPAATSNQFPILAGDFKRGYLLVSRGPGMLTVDEVTTVGQVKYRYRIRYGGAIRQGNAIKALKWATS
ncbi:MAG TPA: phage major capsid protein [Steroidobacteraceae bacterium]|nr:phage major capsid protein [Steroidobacteraceae bacterium]